MGIGDALMCTAEVKRMHLENRRPVHVVGRDQRPVWSEDIFPYNPRLTRQRTPQAAILVNGPGVRPYIAGRTDRQWTWRRNRDQQPGEIYLTPPEKAFGARFAGYVLIEPNVKATNGHTNKAWPFERFQAVVNELGIPMVQTGGPNTTRWLERVERVHTPTFRMACSVLSHCRAFVGTEGALHHAAAALGVPAVVLWSHFIAPDITGYADQTNIRHAGDPCGSRVPCKQCEISMAAISVEEVTDALGRMVL